MIFGPRNIPSQYEFPLIIDRQTITRIPYREEKSRVSYLSKYNPSCLSLKGFPNSTKAKFFHQGLHLTPSSIKTKTAKNKLTISAVYATMRGVLFQFLKICSEKLNLFIRFTVVISTKTFFNKVFLNLQQYNTVKKLNVTFSLINNYYKILLTKFK